MNFREIQDAIEHLTKSSKCTNCESKYSEDDTQVIATTKLEGLFEMKCKKCKSSTIVTVVLSPEIEVKSTEQNKQNTGRKHEGISKNDILDIKNFLNNFDGDFKRIFSKET